MEHFDADYDDSTRVPAETGVLVLLAEPDADRRMAYADALQQAGYSVRSIAEPSEVPAEAGRIMPALIIARVNDSITDGFMLCRGLRSVAETRDTPLLILMRLDDMYTREQIVRAGATAILIEPLRRTLLLRQVRRLLARGARTAAHSRSTSWSASAFTVSRAAS